MDIYINEKKSKWILSTRSILYWIDERIRLLLLLPMASTGSNTNLAKKRHSFLSHFLSTKNLSIFRTKSPTIDNKLYQSQNDIHFDQTSAPVCISRGWLKRHAQRPISFDLDLIKDSIINNHQQHLSGTIKDSLCLFISQRSNSLIRLS